MITTNAVRRTFWWTVFIVLLAVCLMDIAFWFGLMKLGGAMATLVTAANGLPEITHAVQTFHSLEHYVLIFGLPGSFGIFLFVVGFLRIVYRPCFNAQGAPPSKSSKKSAGAESESARAEKRVQDQRLFLHLISVLQRKGRLMDFFAEDLTSYDDTQIGAAVREIHATCRGVVEKSLSLKPVINQIEGETVTIQPGFDPGSVKLVGNVSGKPPFSGVLRHRGWQAGRLEMPTLSSSQDPSIIAPAEVEIL